MLARLRRSTEDEGFTLVELLVVMIIIGILAAVAVPVFLNQRKKAVDSSIKADLKTIAAAEETNFIDTGRYVPVPTALGTELTIGETVKVSPGNLFAILPSPDGTAFCIKGTNGGSTAPRTGIYYISDKGGLQPAGTISCGF